MELKPEIRQNLTVEHYEAGHMMLRPPTLHGEVQGDLGLIHRRGRNFWISYHRQGLTPLQASVSPVSNPSANKASPATTSQPSKAKAATTVPQTPSTEYGADAQKVQPSEESTTNELHAPHRSGDDPSV